MRYVVLHHTGGPDPAHYDLLIERQAGAGDLAAWRLPEWPVTAPSDARPLRDHRRFYLTYQGEISDGRGQVVRIAEGSATIAQHPAHLTITFPHAALEFHPQSPELHIVRPATPP